MGASYSPQISGGAAKRRLGEAFRDIRRRAPRTFAIVYELALELPRISAPPRPRHTFKISHVLKGLRKKTLLERFDVDHLRSRMCR